MSDDRDRIAARIRALLAKTVENGCTEEEALSAARKAAELLVQYNLTVDEVQMRKSKFKRHTEHFDDAVGERLWKIADAVAHLTGSRYWVSPTGVTPVEINFFGFDHEVDVSRYLLEVCANAMRSHEVKLKAQHRLLRPSAQRRYILPFLDGIADRLNKRIKEMKPPAPEGKGLIVLHKELVDAALKGEGLQFKSRSTRDSRYWDATYRNGVAAGDSVSLNRAVRERSAAAGLLS